MASTPGRIPREAYRYWPTLSDSIHGHGRFAQRAIFKRQEYTELEEAALDKFDSALDSDLQLRQRARDKVERADLLRLLYAAEWDVSQALEKLRTYVSWYEQDLVSARSAELLSFQHVLVRTSQAAGGFYTFGRDCYYRPILVLVPSRLQSVCFPLVSSGSSATHGRVSAGLHRDSHAVARANRRLGAFHRHADDSACAIHSAG